MVLRTKSHPETHSPRPRREAAPLGPQKRNANGFLPDFPRTVNTRRRADIWSVLGGARGDQGKFTEQQMGEREVALGARARRDKFGPRRAWELPTRKMIKKYFLPSSALSPSPPSSPFFSFSPVCKVLLSRSIPQHHSSKRWVPSAPLPQSHPPPFPFFF